MDIHYNSYGSILCADFAARKGGSLEALELEGMINAIFYAMNNKWYSINMYTNFQTIVKRLQGDDTVVLSFLRKYIKFFKKCDLC